MPTSIQEIYSEIIRNLSPAEQLRLATLILNDLVQKNITVIDESDTWTQQDQVDLSVFSMQYVTTLFPDEEEVIE
ncbi:hypothetical protein [Gloeothece verrucosa]|uniref:Uncharacterized protein n=1 Tax=Gloeothece verrucosa (strain PCC 7822) TaxID=497965 RepID=E0U7C8_GLOV7|nr:hypothetical protein [Gloeothece verrucosa]ADN12515.1 conserved hypothetical protein [Gloeothece verrucosa PCC 7822]